MANKPENEFLFIYCRSTFCYADKDGKTLRDNTNSVTATWLAFGLEYKVVFTAKAMYPKTNFQGTLAAFSLFRVTLAHSFKDKADRLEDVNAGLFTYPSLWLPTSFI